jgi:hypothetical protein
VPYIGKAGLAAQSEVVTDDLRDNEYVCVYFVCGAGSAKEKAGGQKAETKEGMGCAGRAVSQS